MARSPLDALRGLTVLETREDGAVVVGPVGWQQAREVIEAHAPRCGSCRWFNPAFALDENPAESLGLCEWPAERLPHSLRYGNRERMAVGPLEGTACPAFEHAGGPA